MTIELMRKCGISVSYDNQHIQVSEGEYIIGENLNEADWSAASYWYSLVALVEGSMVTLGGLHQSSIQGDKAVADIYKHLGVKSEWQGNNLVLSNSGSITSTVTFNLLQNPDIAPSVAVTCAGLNVQAELKGLETLVIKESNRLDALVVELTKLGFNCQSRNGNTLVINKGNSGVNDNFIHTYSDHRIAMSLSLLATRVGQLLIDAPGVVNKSYPNFWDDLQKVGFEVTS
jgi:3-phosphoshikimate 1-carboxyvinyltransferase